MREVEFREWLETKGAKTQAGRNSRIYAVKTIEKNLAALAHPTPTLLQPTLRMDLRSCVSGSNKFAAASKKAATNIDF